MDLHRRGELRSLAYHRAIAARLETNPELLTRAVARVADWQAGIGSTHPQWAAEWARLLSLPLAELVEILGDDGEPMIAARSSSPFAGALSPRERWEIWREVGAEP